MNCKHVMKEGVTITTVTNPAPLECLYCRAEKAEARVAELVAAADRYLRATGEEPAHVGIPARLARSVLWGLVEDARTGPSVSEEKKNASSRIGVLPEVSATAQSQAGGALVVGRGIDAQNVVPETEAVSRPDAQRADTQMATGVRVTSKAKGAKAPEMGLFEYANTIFFVTSGGGTGSVFDDPADAIAEAEELAEAEGAEWFVIGLRATEDPPVHIARPAKKTRKKR